VCECVRETEINIVGVAINCDNLERAVFLMNGVEYKKKEITWCQYSKAIEYMRVII